MKRQSDGRIQRIEEGNTLYEIDLECVEKKQREQQERSRQKETSLQNIRTR